MKLDLEAQRDAANVPGDFYGTAETAHEARVSIRQLQWWDEHYILKPAQLLHRKLYTREQVDRAARFGQLRKAGVPLKRLHKYAALPWTSVVRVRTKRPTIIGNVLVVASE